MGRNRIAKSVVAGGARYLLRIVRASSRGFRDALRGLVNPYGDGHAAERIVERLATVELGEGLLMKKFHDVQVPA